MSVLAIDPDLARAVANDERARADSGLVVEIMELSAGPWEPPSAPGPAGHLGLLLAVGLLVREVCVGDSWSAELLSPGDLLRPWVEDAASFVEADWRVVKPARVAVLDSEFAHCLVRWPELVEELIDRTMRRSRAMAVHAAIAGTRRIEDRLLLLFWHLAERWGRREPAGIRIDLALTHETLAHVVGARRPTVTTALGALARKKVLLRRSDNGWLLRGDPPGTATPSTTTDA